jgi:23S rRNA (cytosine1962-C5)-methyltransferase
MSYDRRQRLYPELLSNNQCLRLIHNEGTPLRVDLLGSVAHAGWWHETPPTKAEQDALEIFFEMMTIRSWSLQNYGKQRQLENKFFIDKAPESWLAEENGLTYEFTKSIGAAPGLFLDQREHRKWIQKNSANKRVLNLFAYTGGFSLNAAKGGASEVVTVDLSAKYKEWAQKNFSLNQLSSPSFKFYDMDSFDYLLYAKKKGLLFDMILCDPPSFSRSKKGQFQIDRDYGKLLEMSLAVLAPGGDLLFSTNYEQWSASQWMQKIRINKALHTLEIKDNFSLQWDFDWHSDNAQMKAFHLRKK